MTEYLQRAWQGYAINFEAGPYKSNESVAYSCVSDGFIGRVILSHSCAIAHIRAKKREFYE